MKLKRKGTFKIHREERLFLRCHCISRGFFSER
jgi:hypothetical protein